GTAEPPPLSGGVFPQGPPAPALPEAGGAQRHLHLAASPPLLPVRAERPHLPRRAAPRGDPHLPQPGAVLRDPHDGNGPGGSGGPEDGQERCPRGFPRPAAPVLGAAAARGLALEPPGRSDPRHRHPALGRDPGTPNPPHAAQHGGIPVGPLPAHIRVRAGGSRVRAGVWGVLEGSGGGHGAQSRFSPPQIHCISTEFTLRKNGGEKGVPFRIQIDTFGAGGKGDPPEHLHSASCLVKVFKPKGADRKQKTDREKVEKQPAAEREKFQPAYDSTVLAECPPWPDALGVPHSPPGTPGLPSPHPFKLLSPERVCVSPACAAEGPAESLAEELSPCASPLETQQWLLRRRFSSCARVFSNFSGADLLRLSRRDLIQICGAPDGIRLCHALAGRCPRPRLTLYVAQEPGGAEAAEDAGSGLYQELHLEHLTVAELTGKLAELLGLPPGQILRLSRQGPGGIHVLVSDAMIRNLQDETSFVVAIGKAPGPDGFQLLLR
uniref:Grh/CP2 DB domain-containing protein n=1 Tax=Catharus ustulatus TaxID=91951 RepID=A0A8C3UVH2_CATUS